MLEGEYQMTPGDGGRGGAESDPVLLEGLEVPVFSLFLVISLKG